MTNRAPGPLAPIAQPGSCRHVPARRAIAATLPSQVRQVTANRYRDPAQLGPGGVLVVGARATGVQLAEELQRSGRQVTLAVGKHTRVPRRYRGRDIMWWLDRMGSLDRRFDEVRDLSAAREEPSFQLVGAIGDSSLRALRTATLRSHGALELRNEARCRRWHLRHRYCTVM